MIPDEYGSGNVVSPAKREPVAHALVLVLLIQVFVRKMDWPMDDETARIVADGLSVVILAAVRQLVMPVATVKAAGLSPETVTARAKDPAVVPFRG
jgi:hypothetical protein